MFLCDRLACDSPKQIVFSWVQGFRSAEEVQRFSDMMDEMCYIVATKHSGSLKARPCRWPACLWGEFWWPSPFVLLI